MSTEVAILASSIVTSFLVPYAKIGLEKLVSTVGEKVGELAGTHVQDIAQKVWKRLETAFGDSPERTVMTQLQQYPEQAAPLAIEILKQKLAQDTQLAKELDQLINTPGPSGQSASVEISNAGIAGIVNAPNSTFSGKGQKIAGVLIDKSKSNESDESEN